LKNRLFILFSVFFLAGCSIPLVYKEVLRDEPAYNTREFSVSSEIVYQAAIDVICAKKFIIESEDKA